MNKKRPSEILVTLMLMLGIGVLAFVGIKELIGNIRDSQKLKEYVETEGVVAGRFVEERTTTSTVGGGRGTPSHTGTRRHTIYISIVEYSVDGRLYALNGPGHTSPESMGTKKTVFYNPYNPEESLMKEHISDTWYSLFIILLILVPAVFFFRFVFKLFFRSEEQEPIHGTMD